MHATEAQNKTIYRSLHDEIAAKRFNSPYPIRRHVHREMYERVLEFVEPGTRVLDAGCGEGTLSLLMAQRGAIVVGVDYSRPNIEAATRYRAAQGLTSLQVTFLTGDAENLPFRTGEFDLVVSNHVLEHLPNFQKGLSEVARVAKSRAVVGIPTCLSPYAWTLLGGANYWKFGKRSVPGFILGALRVMAALILGQEGVNEGYIGRKELIHIFRFPWKMNERLREARLRLISRRPQGLGFPYVPLYLTSNFAQRALSAFGLGTVFYVEKID